MIGRRRFITLFGGAAAVWPLAARAQQDQPTHRIGVLLAFNETDTRPKGWLSRFAKGLSELGWVNGGNVRMDVRWAGDDVDRMRLFAKELVGLKPDVILAFGTPKEHARPWGLEDLPSLECVRSDLWTVWVRSERDRSNANSHWVSPHTTSNGNSVSGHYQTNPNNTQLDNYGTRGNANPDTGAVGTRGARY